MRKSFLFLILGFVCLGSDALTVTLTHPERWCARKSWGICRDWRYPLGTHWYDAGVSDSDQGKMAIAFIGDVPAKSAVKNIVFLSSGQQGSSGGADESNVISGFKSGWSFDGISAQEELDSRSLAHKVYHGALNAINQARIDLVARRDRELWRIISVDRLRNGQDASTVHQRLDHAARNRLKELLALARQRGELAADADVGLLSDTLNALGERAVARYLEATTASRRAVAESLAAQTALLITPYLAPST